MGIGVDVCGSPRGQRCRGQPGAILGRLWCHEVLGLPRCAAGAAKFRQQKALLLLQPGQRLLCSSLRG